MRPPVILKLSFQDPYLVFELLVLVKHCTTSCLTLIFSLEKMLNFYAQILVSSL